LRRHNIVSSADDKFDKALQLSRRIVQLADSGSWDEMQRLDQERKSVLEDLFATDTSELPDVKEKIEQIIRLNDQAMERCSKAKESLLSDQKKMKLGKQAITAYRDNPDY
jgi:hypothetical protein